MRAGDDSFEHLRAAIEQLAAADVADLVAEARIEARARVRSMLTEAMAQAMLERAREELPVSRTSHHTPSRPAPARSSSPDEGSQIASGARADHRPAVSGLGWYVYCVTETDEQPIVAGLGGIDSAYDVTTLAHGSLEAVVSRVPLDQFGEEELRSRLSDMAWLEGTARRHEAVLDAVRERRTLVPMRLCSIYREESGVRMMLEREHKTLQVALHRVRGKAEWGVKVFLSGAQSVRSSPQSESSGTQPGSPAAEPGSEGAPGAGTAYLERRRHEHGERHQAGRRVDDACEAIHDRLSAVAVEARLIAPQRPEVSGHAGDMILNGVYLVADREAQRFAQTVTSLGNEVAPLGLELERTGPWPAYNFIPDTIGTAW